MLADGSIEGFVGGHCASGSVRTAALAALDTGDGVLLRVLPDSADVFPEAPGASIVVNPCGTYQVKPSAETIAQCNQFLGPTQPGVTTRDPTRSGASSASAPAPAAPASTKTDTTAALDYLLGK